MPQPDRAIAKVWSTRTRHRAYVILADRHWDEYAAILAEVRVDDPRPVPPRKRGRKPRHAA